MAFQIALRLQEKLKPPLTPRMALRIHLAIINAKKATLAGKQVEQKSRYLNPGYQGGTKIATLKSILGNTYSESAVKKAVQRTLTTRPRARKRHPHTAQHLQTLDLRLPNDKTVTVERLREMTERIKEYIDNAAEKLSNSQREFAEATSANFFSLTKQGREHEDTVLSLQRNVIINHEDMTAKIDGIDNAVNNLSASLRETNANILALKSEFADSKNETNKNFHEVKSTLVLIQHVLEKLSPK